MQKSNNLRAEELLSEVLDDTNIGRYEEQEHTEYVPSLKFEDKPSEYEFELYSHKDDMYSLKMSLIMNKGVREICFRLQEVDAKTGNEDCCVTLSKMDTVKILIEIKRKYPEDFKKIMDIYNDLEQSEINMKQAILEQALNDINNKEEVYRVFIPSADDAINYIIDNKEYFSNLNNDDFLLSVNRSLSSYMNDYLTKMDIYKKLDLLSEGEADKLEKLIADNDISLYEKCEAFTECCALIIETPDYEYD